MVFGMMSTFYFSCIIALQRHVKHSNYVFSLSMVVIILVPPFIIFVAHIFYDPPKLFFFVLNEKNNISHVELFPVQTTSLINTDATNSLLSFDYDEIAWNTGKSNSLYKKLVFHENNDNFVDNANINIHVDNASKLCM